MSAKTHNLKSKEFVKGDVVLLPDGRMFRLMSETDEDMVIVLFMEEEGQTFVTENKMFCTNLGQKPEILAIFYSTRSLHTRLNRLNDV